MSYILSLPLAKDSTLRGVESSPINNSPSFIFSINLTVPSDIKIGVPLAWHLPVPKPWYNNKLL